ncbi:MAG TPA: homoserine dehydrogenase [Firmicutes bacterium]|nr:homoserine dehydrogenase [Candidatus Fermentithermobacillaceae bacterium]
MNTTSHMQHQQPKDVREVRLNLIGFGNVGKALARILLDKGDEFRMSNRAVFKVTAIATGRHGYVVDPHGVDLARILSILASGEPLGGCSGRQVHPEAVLNIIKNAPGDAVVEMTPLNHETGEPAISYVKAALAAGKHVVSANKGPVALAYSDLACLAARHGLQFLFESTVMDGAPIFNMARYCLRGTRILGFKAILNSTTNFILGEMEKGCSFHDSIIEAQNEGFAEADSSMDIDGWDAAVKTAALSNVLLGVKITPRDVKRTGIRDVKQPDVAKALEEGKRIKLVAEAGFGGLEAGQELSGGCPDTFYAVVRPVYVDKASIFGQVNGATSCLVLKTGLMGDITLIEHAPTLTQTAYGVLNDLLEIADEI